MSEKVKLPREVAEAIESLSKKWGRKAFLQAEYLKNAMHPEVVVLNDYFKPFDSADPDGFDKLVFALYLGYEVEETPEERIKKTFERFERSEVGREVGFAGGIKFALNELGIKIEGVNA